MHVTRDIAELLPRAIQRSGPTRSTPSFAGQRGELANEFIFAIDS